MKKLLFALSALLVALMLIAAGSVATQVEPKKTSTFSYVQELTGDIETDIANFVEAERSLGIPEEAIQKSLVHFRAALEKSKYNVYEIQTFSVVVDATDVNAYQHALEAEGLPAEIVQGLVESFHQHANKTQQEFSIAGVACKRRTDGAVAYNAFGQVLYQYSSSIYWCYNGSVIVDLDDWETYSTFWGWQFMSSTRNSRGGVGQTSFILHRQATMYNRLTGWTAYPSTHQGVYGNGTSWGEANP
ncbi:MAG: hypothetical protein WHS87_05725 [Anaerolineales bacterium]